MMRVFGKLESKEGTTAGIFGMRGGSRRRGTIKLRSSTWIYNGRKAQNQRPELVSQRANKETVRDNGVLVGEETKDKGGLWPFQPAILGKREKMRDRERSRERRRERGSREAKRSALPTWHQDTVVRYRQLSRPRGRFRKGICFKKHRHGRRGGEIEKETYSAGRRGDR